MVNERPYRSYTARSKNKSARSVLFGLFASSLIFVLAAILSPKYSGIIWFVALIFITASIYVYNRYVGSEYYYEISDCGGRPSFIINMKVGNTSKTMARIDLDTITEVRKLTGKEYRKYKCEKGVLKYPYFPTMFSEEVYLVSVRSEHENADLFIEADEEFASALTYDI